MSDTTPDEPTDSPFDEEEFDRLRSVLDAPKIETDLRVLQVWAYENSKSKRFHEFGDELRKRLAKAEQIAEDVREEGVDSWQHEEFDADARFYNTALVEHYGNRLMLIAGEVSEAHEELRHGRDVTETYYEVTHGEPMGKPVGFPSEVADVFIRLLDLCQEAHIDLATITSLKMAYNATRAPMHGGKTM